MAGQFTPEIRSFLEEKRFAVLATINPDGTPQQTVMWYALEDGRIMMNTKRRRRKDRNILRDQRISLCVEEGERFVTISGTAVIDEDRARGQATARALAVRYDGEEKAEEQMRNDYSKQERITIYLPIESVITHGFHD
ncbi:MAG TPA: PPOX class F420-dependent oxidoreductase [Thermomicrobiales bacterium]|nr:PPOX class F420-dependent oxidoreductase [Thermomicrobiales bacterium]